MNEPAYRKRVPRILTHHIFTHLPGTGMGTLFHYVDTELCSHQTDSKSTVQRISDCKN